jgi:phosphoribosyl-dephospho-CoA transferase
VIAAPPPRHHLVWLAPGWLRALRVASDPALLTEADRWFELGRPAVAARRDPAAPGDAVALGVALPGGAGRRLALLVARSAIARIAPPVRLRDAVASAPAAWRSRLRALDAEAGAAGVPLSVYGSLAWQHLSGEPYVTAGSDVDLLAPGRTSGAARAALDLLRPHARDAAPALDGELLLGGGRAVAWRELLSGATRVLVKSADAVRLEPAAQVLDPA